MKLVIMTRALRISVISTPQERAAHFGIRHQRRTGIGIGVTPLHQNKSLVSDIQRLFGILLDPRIIPDLSALGMLFTIFSLSPVIPKNATKMVNSIHIAAMN